MNEKSREVVRVCYYPVDGLFIHVFVTKLTREGARERYPSKPCHAGATSGPHFIHYIFDFDVTQMFLKAYRGSALT